MTSSEAGSSEAAVHHQKENDSRFNVSSVVLWNVIHIRVAEDHMEVTLSHLKASGC